ncbi:AraC family transcriptional regulator [Paenibacillus lemnae]|uniref:AraC family transcriptional regulator n=1 Tax=Paenibacillus lemnae TaxID=1330551 RepID=A0A848MAI5_PAELE|nr:AraC family transcriptional regulator [Paenibacillus lemnae]NMO97269.1 AraC family transcriptional regulator [Paenibacillus lemnae]
MQFITTNITKPLEFISCGQFISELPWLHAKRTINNFEIIIGIKQTLYIQQAGVQYEVKPGNVLLLQPDVTHLGYRESEKGLSFYWFHFNFPQDYQFIDSDLMNEKKRCLRNDPDSQSKADEVFIPIFSAPHSIERINILFHQLLHTVQSNYYTNYSTYYLLTSLIIELSEQTITDFNILKNEDGRKANLEKIIEWTRIHALNNLTVAMVADKFNYNKAYLSRYFKKGTGMNLQEYIHLQKIAKAKDLLSRSMLSIKEVSSAVGIPDEKYFMKLFKKYENITPTNFRQAYTKTYMNND